MASEEQTRRKWRSFADVYARLGVPLVPTPGDVAAIRSAIAGADGRMVMLGVTPALSSLGRDLTAVDAAPRMLTEVWPGDGDGRRAMIADWTDLPFADAGFTAAIGDGSLNACPGALEGVFAELRRVLAPGGVAAFRFFAAPETPEPLSDIAADVERGAAGNFHALKWRIAMSLCAGRPHAAVPVEEIRAAFDAMFPDRGRLAAATGWEADSIETIDAYEGATHSLAFPTLSALRALGAPLGQLRVVPAKGYPLAERCPVVAWRA